MTPPSPVSPKTIWIDVEDLFEYTARNQRPSGIQRLAFELYQVLQEQHGATGRIRFVRLNPVRKSFATIPWQSVVDLFALLADAAGPTRSPDRPKGIHRKPETAIRHKVRRLVYRLPLELRHKLLDTTRLQIAAIAAGFSLLAYLAHGLRTTIGRPFRPRRKGADTKLDLQASAEAFAQAVQPGDVVLALGAPWSDPDYAGLIEATRARHGIRFAFLVHDIIPLRCPQWCVQGLVRLFRAWFVSVLPLADHIFANSRYTADDLVRFAAQSGIPLRNTVEVIPVGAGFPPDALPPRLPQGNLPMPGSYVLFVSTIEARKNHAMMFRIWRRLLEELPKAEVPTLVFAGQVGWLVADLMQQLDNTGYLDGKIVILSDLSDSELGELYRGCLFTVFPSFYEGWGLPVTESLAFGKPCLASSRTAIPEAGGRFARYIDPDNLTQAYQIIRETIEDRDGLAAWQADIRDNYHPTPWLAGATAIVKTLLPSDIT